MATAVKVSDELFEKANQRPGQGCQIDLSGSMDTVIPEK